MHGPAYTDQEGRKPSQQMRSGAAPGKIAIRLSKWWHAISYSAG